MNLIYNSDHFCVVEFFDPRSTGTSSGGYEIMDKGLRREIYLRGRDAEQFRANVQELIAQEPGPDEVDAFLGQYTSLMTQTVALH